MCDVRVTHSSFAKQCNVPDIIIYIPIITSWFYVRKILNKFLFVDEFCLIRYEITLKLNRVHDTKVNKSVGTFF